MSGRQLVVFEGIMGSGKSTTTLWLAERLSAKGVPAHALTEKVFPHPLRTTDELEHCFEPWLDVTAEQLASRRLAKWALFVDSALATGEVTALDGQLFHGDLTNLFMMEADMPLMSAHIQAIAQLMRPLRPLVIYFHQQDVERAIHKVCADRGEEWVNYQTGWKLQSPYSRRRGLTGLHGLVRLYEDYRRLTDRLFAMLELDKLGIENSAGDWPAYHRAIEEAMG